MSFAFNKWWGWGLIGIGVVFALENFGIDLDFIWDLWPLALIGLGVYILRAPAGSEKPAETTPPLPQTIPDTDADAVQEDDKEL